MEETISLLSMTAVAQPQGQSGGVWFGFPSLTWGLGKGILSHPITVWLTRSGQTGKVNLFYGNRFPDDPH